VPKRNLKERIGQGILLLDGAMGTQLLARGAVGGGCNELLNKQSPDIVAAVHHAYLQAGTDAILTNTFGANKFSLTRHGLADKVNELNKAAAQLARRCAGESHFVLGDIGPTGNLLEPLGDMKPADCRDAFAQQTKALLAGGVDGFIIETMTALEELSIAVEAVKSVCGNLPVLASMAFDKTEKDFRTMMGVSVEKMVAKIVPLGVDAVGFNCGSATLDEYVELAKKFVSAVETTEKIRTTSHERRVTILAEPNAGKPQLIDDKAVYTVTAEDFAIAAEKIHSAGAAIIGGCCGTSPEHIAAAAKKLK
jgi:5-methyltetrahydrofolate--homocysteine methyltransferase